MRWDKVKYATIFLVIIHLVGILGLSIEGFRPYFVGLTPVTLIISVIVLLFFHKDWSQSFYICISLLFFLGWGIEVLGVSTGVVFGQYQYTGVLGVRLLDTPLMIGVNWLMLIYMVGVIFKMFDNIVIKAIAGASLLVLLDLFIEPVAIGLRFWVWEGDQVPILNYVAWFLISFVLLIVFYLFPFKKENSIAFRLFSIQFLFFVILSLIL